MCIQTKLTVRAVNGNTAVMEDGRKVLLGSVQHASKGDVLMVYANIALEKVTHDGKGDT